MTVWEWVIHQVQNNQFLVAAMGASLLFALRQAPVALYKVLKDQFTVTLRLFNEDQIYNHVDLWLARNHKAHNSRRLNMVEGYDYDKEDWEWDYTLGGGVHMIWDEGRFYLLHRIIKDQGDMGMALGAKRQFEMTITTFGRSQKPLRHLVEKCKRLYTDDDTIKVYYWTQGHYALADRKRKRSMDTVFLPQVVKQDLIDDVLAFERSREEYTRRGDPYRRSIGLEGPPGTGKSTIAITLASLLNRDVYVISLSSCTSDADFQSATNQVGRNGLALLEDVDTSDITHERDPAPVAAPVVVPNGVPVPNAEKGVRLTLSGVLNGLDGVAAREGRITILTTNHIDKLDEALKRPGRMDKRITVGLIEPTEALEMTNHYWPGLDNTDWFNQTVQPALPMSPAALREMLIERKP